MTCNIINKMGTRICHNIEFKNGLCKTHYDRNTYNNMTKSEKNLYRENKEKINKQIRTKKIDSCETVLSSDNVYIEDKDMFLSDLFSKLDKLEETVNIHRQQLYNIQTVIDRLGCAFKPDGE
jgi:hypothetical protein